jgi:hypothetical protein
VALTAVVVVRRLRLHRRWLSYRVLAERFRSAGYLSLLGADVRRTSGLQRVYVEHQPEDWLHRAFVEVWDRRPRQSRSTASTDAPDLGELKWLLAETWVAEQIHFYTERAPRNLRRDSILSKVVFVSFLAAIVFAGLHSQLIQKDSSVTLSVFLPAFGGSVGALLTIAQYKALGQRYDRASSELTFHQAAIHEAASLSALVAASSDAARAIAEETGDWLGAMWFLDIEHP